LTNFKLFSL